MTEGEAQAALAGAALELVAIADRLQRIHDELPTARNRDAMLEHRMPRDVATEIYGVIEAVLVDEIRPHDPLVTLTPWVKPTAPTAESLTY